MEIHAVPEPNVKQPYGYIYITYDITNHRYYCGKHKSSAFDTSYYGSGTLMKKALQMYPRSNFVVIPIDWAETAEELSQKEIQWIQYYNAIEDIHWYNLSDGNLVQTLDTHRIKQMLQDWITQNRPRFSPSDCIPETEHYGFETAKYIAIYPSVFDELIRSWGFHVNMVKRQLQIDGVIQKPAGKNLNGVLVLQDKTQLRMVLIYKSQLNLITQNIRLISALSI